VLAGLYHSKIRIKGDFEMLKQIVRIGLVFGLLLVVLAPVSAQDMMGEKVVCDSTLVTLLFIAEYEYGYEPMLDVGMLEKGQFAPWFEAMMSMMADGMMEEEMMSDDMMDDMMMDDMMMDDMMVTLVPGDVDGEDSFCTALRADVEKFLYDAIGGKMMMVEN
jgi:hypothetical protein